MKTQRVTASLAILLALVAAPALSGCSIQQLVSNATGGDVSLPGKSIPADFPKDDVPLIDGEIILGAGAGNEDGKAWNITIAINSLDQVDEIKSELEGAGFTANDAGVGGVTDEGATLVYGNDKYTVAVVVTKGGDTGFIANYTVAEVASN